jgi:hypothetical protein
MGRSAVSSLPIGVKYFQVPLTVEGRRRVRSHLPLCGAGLTIATSGTRPLALWIMGCARGVADQQHAADAVGHYCRLGGGAVEVGKRRADAGERRRDERV